MFRFEDPIFLWLLWVLPVLVLVRFIGWRRRKAKLKKLGDPGYIAANDSNQCVPCADRGCSYCHSQNFFSCLKCFPEYTLTNRQCGFKCNSIDKCQLCSYDATECVKCIKSCSLEGGKCSCVARNVIIVLLTILNVLIVGIVAYCLMNSKFAKKFSVIEGALGIPIGNGQKVFERGANEIVSIAEKPTMNVSAKFSTRLPICPITTGVPSLMSAV